MLPLLLPLTRCVVKTFSLTIADSILILDMVWQKSIVHSFMEPFMDISWYNKTYPYIWHPIKGMTLSATIFMVVAVSAERFRAVCYPLSRHHVSFIVNIHLFRGYLRN